MKAKPLCLSFALAALASATGASAQSAANSTSSAAASTGPAIVQLEKVIAVAGETERANSFVNPTLRDSYSPAVNPLNLIGNLPGVNVQQGDPFGGDDWSTSISLRGFKSDRDSNQLGWTIDGLPNGNTNYGGGTKINRLIDPENVSLVAVSQGSADIASAAAQALGGTIEYYSLNPTRERGATTAVTIGDNELRRYFVRANTGELAGGTRAYVSLSDQRHHRWMATGSQGRTDRLHVDSKLESALGQTEVTARLSYDDIYENNYNGVTLAQFEANPEWDFLTGDWTGRPEVDQNYILGWATVRTNWLGALRFDNAPKAGLKLQAQPYWHHQKGRGDWMPPYQRLGYTATGTRVDAAPLAPIQARAFFRDASGNPIPVGDPTKAPAGVTFHAPSNPYDITTYPEAVRAGAVPISSFRTSEYEFDRYGATFGARWETNENNTLKVGGWYEQLERDWGRDWHKVLDARVGYDWDHRPYWTDFASELKTNTLMFYAQDSLRRGDLRLTGGLKAFFVELDYRDRYGVSPSKSFNSDSDVLPSVGFVYDLGRDRGQVFGNYAKNFSAVLDEVITRDLSRSLEPETADTFDLGYRVTRGSVSASAAGYFAKFNNRITFVTPRTAGGVTQINYDIGQGGGYVNVGGIESQGVEAAVSVDITRNFGSYVSATWNRSEYTRTIPENGVLRGNKVVGSPETLLSGAVFYRRDGYTASLTGKYTGERKGTLDNRDTLEAYTLFDASLGYRARLANGGGFKGFAADLRVSNLFDKHHLAGLDGGGGYYFIGAPRTVSFTLSLDF